MNQAIKLFLKESVELELNVAELYQLFSVKFPRDYHFWWKISLEEMNHAALIDSINDFFFTETILPFGELERYTEEIHQINLNIKARTELYKTIPPTRSEAFNYGFELENSAGESHYEFFMTSELISEPMGKVFQKLNGDDINHAKRIEKYRRENNIV